MLNTSSKKIKTNQEEPRHSLAFEVINSGNVNKTIKVLLDSRDTAILPILVNGWKVSALFDTGGTITLVSERISRLLRSDLKPWGFTTIKGISGSVEPKGVIEDVTIAFREKAVTMAVTVIPGLLPHVILGVDFLKSARLSPSAFGTVTDTPDVGSCTRTPYACRVINERERKQLQYGPTLEFSTKRKHQILRPDGLTTDDQASDSDNTIIVSNSDNTDSEETNTQKIKSSVFQAESNPTTKPSKRSKPEEATRAHTQDSSIALPGPSSSRATAGSSTQVVHQATKALKRKSGSGDEIKPASPVKKARVSRRAKRRSKTNIFVKLTEPSKILQTNPNEEAIPCGLRYQRTIYPGKPTIIRLRPQEVKKGEYLVEINPHSVYPTLALVEGLIKLNKSTFECAFVNTGAEPITVSPEEPVALLSFQRRCHLDLVY